MPRCRTSVELEALGLLKSLADEHSARNEAEASVLRYLRIYSKLHPAIIAEKKHSRTELFDIIFGENERAKVTAHKAYNARYREHAGAVTPFQDGLPEYLQLFRAAGIRLAVATNRSREFLEAELLALAESTGFDWRAVFDVLVCADDIEGYKPWPGVLMTAMSGTPRQSDGKSCAWYFGDSPSDMLTARRADAVLRDSLPQNGDRLYGVYFDASTWSGDWLPSQMRDFESGQNENRHHESRRPAAACASFGQLRTLLADLATDSGNVAAASVLTSAEFKDFPARQPPPPRLEPDWHPAVARLVEPHVILFDWHATLVDTLYAMYHAVDDMLQRLDSLGLRADLLAEGDSRNPEDARLVEHVRQYGRLHPKIRADRKISRTDIFEVLFGDNQPAKLRAHAAFNAHYRQHFGTVLPFEPDIAAMLQGLRDLGIITGVITNRDREFYEQELAIVEDGRWVSLFDIDICGDDTPRRKPWPDQVLLALDRLKRGTARDVWYVGDSTTDIRAAAAAGVTGIFFNGAQWDQNWLIRIFPGSAAQPARPDAVVYDFSEFWALVLACKSRGRHDSGRYRR